MRGRGISRVILFSLSSGFRKVVLGVSRSNVWFIINMKGWEHMPLKLTGRRTKSVYTHIILMTLRHLESLERAPVSYRPCGICAFLVEWTLLMVQGGMGRGGMCHWFLTPWSMVLLPQRIATFEIRHKENHIIVGGHSRAHRTDRKAPCFLGLLWLNWAHPDYLSL